ncbi:MAG: hypothetical protein KDD41_05145 [Flavobacteriales bacterium]|nr:hypothetical protein [Flavobacteriales bacterium]
MQEETMHNTDIKMPPAIEHLEEIGLSLSQIPGRLTVTRSKKGKRADKWAIVFGFFSLFFLLGALLFWIRLGLGKEVELMGLIAAILNSFVGGYGIVLFVKGIDRLVSSRISLEVSAEGIDLKKGGLTIRNFPRSAEFQLHVEDDEHEKMNLVLIDAEETEVLFRLSGVNPTYRNSLSRLTDQLNHF